MFALHIYTSKPFRGLTPDEYRNLANNCVNGFNILREMGKYEVPRNTKNLAMLIVLNDTNCVEGIAYRSNPTRQEMKTLVFDGVQFFPLTRGEGWGMGD